MFALVFIEWGLSAWQNKERYEAKDFWASTAIGVGNIIVSSVTKVSIFGLILFFYNMMPWRVPHTWWSYPLCFVFLDFCRYWAHRIAHEQRIWWATHVPHHSSEQYRRWPVFTLWSFLSVTKSPCFTSFGYIRR